MTASDGTEPSRHPIQERMLALETEGADLEAMTTAALARTLGIESVAVVNYHLSAVKGRWRRSRD